MTKLSQFTSLKTNIVWSCSLHYILEWSDIQWQSLFFYGTLIVVLLYRVSTSIPQYRESTVAQLFAVFFTTHDKLGTIFQHYALSQPFVYKTD